MIGWLNRSTNRILPIGLDLGTSQVKAIQMQRSAKGELQPVAAGSVKAPVPAPTSPADINAFFRQTVRPMLDRAGFIGRRTMLALPATHVHLARLRVPIWCNDAGACELVELQAREWLSFPVSSARIRQLDAGEVFDGQEPGREIIAIAMRRDLVDRYLEGAASIRMDVVGVIPPPQAVLAALDVEGSQSTPARMIIDLGQSSARVYAGHGRRLMFARAMQPGANPAQLADELRRCREYVDATFPSRRLDEVVFAGGGSRDRALCRGLAEAIGLPAHLVRSPLPTTTSDWTTATGLSLCGDTAVACQKLAA